MKLKFLLVAALFVLPLGARAQPTNAPKATPAEAQKIFLQIKGDPAKLKAYCEASKLSDEEADAREKKDTKKADELSKKIAELSQQIGPDFVAFMGGLQDVDPNSKESKEIDDTMDQLDKLCGN